MTAAYIEHRPLSTDPNKGVTHHAVVAGGRVVHETKTQKDAAEWAKTQGFSPVHVARERHLQDHDIPDHWRPYKG